MQNLGIGITGMSAFGKWAQLRRAPSYSRDPELRLRAPAVNDIDQSSPLRPKSKSAISEVISKAQRGDPIAFERLYHLYKRRVYWICIRMVANAAEAEDLLQETFLQVFRKIGTFRGEAAFSTWLHRLTVNIVLMRFRKKTLQCCSLDEMVDQQEQSELPKQEFGKDDPALLGAVDRVALEAAIATLPPGYRMVFYLHDIAGYQHDEVAEILGCSVGTSKSQLHKARLSVRNMLIQGSLTQPGKKHPCNLSHERAETKGSADPHCRVHALPCFPIT